MCGLKGFSQNCACEMSKQCIFNNGKISICGYALDSFRTEKLITELTVFNDDSLLINNLHNEGASFLLQIKKDKILLIDIDLQIENGKYKYPEKFVCATIRFDQKVSSVYYSDVKAEPIVDHLGKNFKNITELY